jgi:hypothetical protein
MTEQAAEHKIKQAIRYTLGAKVPHYDFTSIRSDTDDILHNVTTKHFSDHFKALDTSPNFTVNFEDERTLNESKARFMTHQNHQAITPELKELLWTAITKPQAKLIGPSPNTTLRDQLRGIASTTPSFELFSQTLSSKNNESSPGPSGLSYRLLKLLRPQYLEIVYQQ